jgi:hypothetical protein
MNQESVICAANNVHWYRAIFGSHGLSGAIADGMWSSRDRPPPYYSNAVTLAATAQAAQLATIRDLGRVLGSSWSVMDSFSVLDLSPLGFRPLFDAQWIWCDAANAPDTGRGDTDWRRVATSAELERWEAAWRENGSPAESRVFAPDLLADRRSPSLLPIAEAPSSRAAPPTVPSTLSAFRICSSRAATTTSRSPMPSVRSLDSAGPAHRRVSGRRQTRARWHAWFSTRRPAPGLGDRRRLIGTPALDHCALDSWRVALVQVSRPRVGSVVGRSALGDAP